MNIFTRSLMSVVLAALCLPAWSNALAPTLLKMKGNTKSMIEKSMTRHNAKSRMWQSAQDTPSDATANAYTWGILYHEDGCTWYYTQTFEERGWYFGATDITIYDNNFTQVGSIHIDVPEGMNVNDIDPIDFVSTSFFDTNSTTTEIPIFMHAVDNGKQICKIGIYTLEGEKLVEYDAQSMIDFKASDDYIRVLLMNESEGNLNVSVLRAADENNPPVVEHTFSVDQDLLYYNEGPMLNYYSINGEPYYSISHFEVPCMDGMDMETFVPTQAPNNNLIIKTYDKSYNVVDSLGVPIDPVTTDATYGFASLGLMSYKDMRQGDFTNDNRRNYIVTHYEYFAKSDDFIYHFRVYDEDGNFIKNITEYTTMWQGVSDLKGHEEQMVFLKTDQEGKQYFEMIDIPSCNVAATFPAQVDGFQISSTLDRYPVGDDYQYVIGLSQATVDENGDAIARIGWYNRDCSVDHYATFNLGKNSEGFTPYIATYVLDPYMFNTDSRREYFYMAMTKRTDGSEILDKALYLADEDGTVLRTIKPEEGDEIEFSSGDIFDYNTPNPRLVLSFYNGDKDGYEVKFYNLPFDKFTSGGDGTTDNPYVITTPGELAQMHSNNPAAHYVLGNDIDMSEYVKPYFAPAEFTGSFDGQNHFISNITVDEDGIFGTLNQGAVMNLQIQWPTLCINETNHNAGILASNAAQCNIENVHIYDAVIYGNTTNEANYIGGLLGNADNTTINAVSMLHANEYYNIYNFGSIVGSMTNSSINAAVATGEMRYSKNVGGIASLASSSKISNSHTMINQLLPITTGGIAAVLKGGESDAIIEHCYTTGYAWGELDEQNYPYHDYKDIVHTNDGGTISNSVGGQDIYNKSREYFEGMGFAYGNSYDAPWSGEGLPVLYFENEKQSTPTVELSNNSISYDGMTIEAYNASNLAIYNMQGVRVAWADANILPTRQLSRGIYIVVATDAQHNTTTRKIIVQ